MKDNISLAQIQNSSFNVSVDDLEPLEYRILQPIWDLRIGYEDWMQSPLFPVCLSVVFYFSLCSPFMIADLTCSHTSWYQKYKIQPEKEVSVAVVLDALSLTFWNHLMFILPGAVAQWIWVPTTPLQVLAPTLYEFLWQQLASLLIFDFQYYIWHMTHHKVRFLYKTVHAIHHKYTSPFVWVTQYLHPWELITVGFLTTTNMWFFDAHPMTIWSYMLLTIVVSVEDHIGFDFPILPHYWDPTGMIGGSPKHDMHHQKPMTNFEPFFNHWDKMFGSFCPSMGAGGKKNDALKEFELRAKEARKCF